jgi:hypothetical protein
MVAGPSASEARLRCLRLAFRLCPASRPPHQRAALRAGGVVVGNDLPTTARRVRGHAKVAPTTPLGWGLASNFIPYREMKLIEAK